MKARRRIRPIGPSARRAKIGGSARKLSSFFRQKIGELLPARARVLIVSRGDEDLIRSRRFRGAHFPQEPSGRHARYDLASSAAAIAHLEALRLRGADFLVLPATNDSWRESYPEFIRHLQRRYALIDGASEIGWIYSLREKGHWRALDDAISEFRIDYDREPTILNWDSEVQIGEIFPECRWFQPASARSDRLPYLDKTIDFVAISAADAARMKEARRVATAGVIVTETPSVGTSTLSIVVERVASRREKERPSVSLVVAQQDVDLPVEQRLALLGETIPAGLNHEILLHPVDAAKTANLKNAKGDLVVFIGPQIHPLCGWLPPLLRLFAEKSDAGVIGGRLVNFDGTQNHIGAIAGRNGALELLGADEVDPASPAFGFVRELDCCATTFLATRRSLIARCGIPRNFGGHNMAATAAFCSAVHEQGWRVYFEPDCCALTSTPAPALAATRSTRAADVRPRQRGSIARSRAHRPSRNGSELADHL